MVTSTEVFTFGGLYGSNAVFKMSPFYSPNVLFGCCLSIDDTLGTNFSVLKVFSDCVVFYLKNLTCFRIENLEQMEGRRRPGSAYLCSLGPADLLGSVFHSFPLMGHQPRTPGGPVTGSSATS